MKEFNITIDVQPTVEISVEPEKQEAVIISTEPTKEASIQVEEQKQLQVTLN